VEKQIAVRFSITEIENYFPIFVSISLSISDDDVDQSFSQYYSCHNPATLMNAKTKKLDLISGKLIYTTGRKFSPLELSQSISHVLNQTSTSINKLYILQKYIYIYIGLTT
jgi:hypothetical protein